MYGRTILGTILLASAGFAYAHGSAGAGGGDDPRHIEFPDTARYKTLVLDPHTHSVFSDGHVWPVIRVGEALRDGLDAMAITEHLEYQPHRADIPHPDRNRAYEDAAASAAQSKLIVIRGSEITRDLPAGHMNAIFIADANKLFDTSIPASVTDAGEYYQVANSWPAQSAVQAANDQGAFVFWNHAWWGRDFPNNIPEIPKFHKDNAKAKLLHGIEIANGDNYSEETFQIALDFDLTLMGVSDVHNLIDWDYEPAKGGHRPVTLVFAKERTAESIKEALFDGRTVVWFKNTLIGRPKQLEPLLAASLTLDKATYPRDGEILAVTLTNHSDADFELINKSDYTFTDFTDLIQIPAHEAVTLDVKTGKKIKKVDLEFTVLNALVAPKKNPTISLSQKVD